VEFVEHGGEVGAFGGVDLVGPAVGLVNSKSWEMGSSSVSNRFCRFHQATAIVPIAPPLSSPCRLEVVLRWNNRLV
jgi:hypothetical protein